MRTASQHGVFARAAFVLSVAVAQSCAPAAPPVATPAAPAVATPSTWEQKLAWIVRLEDQRILREPNPPAPQVLRPATAREPAVLGPAAPADLLVLMRDREARVRRRAALAAGRVGLSEALPYLAERLKDQESEVRQMAAFAMGLIGDPAARGALLEVLKGADPILQGRAAEALGLIGDKTDAPAVGAMVRAHVAAGALRPIAPDTLDYPLSPQVEATRLGLFALARLGSYDALASAVVDERGAPVSAWWPVAYALQRVGDARAAPALSTLLTQGRYTTSFAIRGLAAAKYTDVIPQLRALVQERKADRAVVIQAIRALAVLGDAGALPLVSRLMTDASQDEAVRSESVTAFATLADRRSEEALIDLLFDRVPLMRAQATRALARVAPESFMVTLSGLDADADWTVRAAQATALGSLPSAAGVARLTLMLEDGDNRVLPAIMAALVAAKAPDAEALLRARLSAQDFAVRAAAAQGLGELKAAGSLDALRAAYQASSNEPSYTARGAILAAIHRIDPAAAKPLLEAALADRDWAIRVRAADLLKEGGTTTGIAERMRPATQGASVDDPAWRALVAPAFSPRASIETEKGVIEIELAVLDAPLTVRNFVTLARKGAFNGVAIHRVVHDFVVQGGDPRGDGEGGPGYTIRDEMNQRPYLRGTVGMALDWRDTGGSQFFITHSPAPHLDGRYTVFGWVVNGMDVVDRIVPWDRIVRVRVRDGISEE
jgi:cyclophilin family peptidyl-prolyl cis-trans isomerase/HEAT repeat protein